MKSIMQSYVHLVVIIKAKQVAWENYYRTMFSVSDICIISIVRMYYVYTARKILFE